MWVTRARCHLSSTRSGLRRNRHEPKIAFPRPHFLKGGLPPVESFILKRGHAALPALEHPFRFQSGAQLSSRWSGWYARREIT